MLVSQENGDGGRRQTAVGRDIGGRCASWQGQFPTELRDTQGPGRRGPAAGEEAWEAQVVAGIRAVLEFAAADPQARARADRRCPPSSHRRGRPRAGGDHLLRRPAPPGGDRREALHALDRGGARRVDRDIVRGHLQLGTADQLPRLAPDLVYITLMPYLGISEARRWASPRRPSGHSGT